jgi:hypothetical protein
MDKLKEHLVDNLTSKSSRLKSQLAFLNTLPPRAVMHYDNMTPNKPTVSDIIKECGAEYIVIELGNE